MDSRPRPFARRPCRGAPAGGGHLDRGCRSLGTAAYGVLAPFHGGHEPGRDRGGHENHPRGREGSPVQGHSRGPGEIGEGAMNPHLTSEEISDWVTGERAPEVQTHIAACACCHSEVESL